MEIVTKFPYYPYIWKDVMGVETIKAVLFRQIEMPVSPAWAENAFSLLLVMALVIGMMFSMRVTRKLSLDIDARRGSRAVIILPLVYTIFLVAGAILYGLY